MPEQLLESNLEVKNHIVIMPDASVDLALDAILASSFAATGIQRFMAPSVAVFVGGSTHWEKELVKCARELKVNAGTEPGTDIGPVISKEAKDRICKLVQSGISSGARLVLDGRHIVVPWYEQGNFLGPTIMCDVTTSMDCYKEDMVGPVLLCMQAENLEEAIALVNTSKHRSGASIFTSSSVASRKFQNEVETSLVGINVPVPLSLPLIMYNGSNIVGDLSFCGKEAVQFFTQLKTVVQNCREFPRRRVQLPHPPTFETETSSQAISALQLPPSERDLVDGVMPKSTPSSITELPCNNVSPSFPPSAEENLPVPGSLPSASSIPEAELSNRDRMNQELSTVMHSPTTVHATGQEALGRMFSSQWGETLRSSENMLPNSERIYMPLDSEMVDLVASTVTREAIAVSSAPTAERFYVPRMSLRNENMGLIASRPPISERVYLPLLSQQNEKDISTSQRSEVSPQLTTPDSVYSSISQRNDDLRSTSSNADVSLHQASRSLDIAFTVPPQTSNTVPQFTEMYSASTIQRINGASSSSSSSSFSERVFIPSTSREMYVQPPNISSVEEYHQQGVS